MNFGKMRLTNIDTLSALLDRLVTERIKWFFFKKNKEEEKRLHQERIIEEIKERISGVYWEVLEKKQYIYLSEKRTFAENSIIESLEELTVNDINIGEADRARLEEVHKKNPNIERMILNEKRLRKANEGRSRNKNDIDNKLAEDIE